MFCWILFSVFGVQMPLAMTCTLEMSESEAGSGCNPHRPPENSSGPWPSLLASSLTSAPESGESPLLWVIIPRTTWCQLAASLGPATDISCWAWSIHRLCWGSSDLGPAQCVNPTQCPGHLEATREQEREEGERRNIYFPIPCSPTCCICFIKKLFQAHHKFREIEKLITWRTCRPIPTDTGDSSRPWAPFHSDFR